MDLTTLLTFIPLGIGIAWLFNLIFKKDLASKPLGNIVTYFVGVLIIILVVGYLLDNMLPSWLNNRYQSSRANVELQQFINTVVGDATSGSTQTVIVNPPTPIPSVLVPSNPAVSNQVNPNPIVADEAVQGRTTAGTTHTVIPGDTLSSIATLYGVDLAALRAANNRIGNDFIYVGEVLVIPASTGK